MKVLHQPSRYCRAFTSLKKCIFILIFGSFFYALLTIQYNVCNKTSTMQSHDNEISPERYETLKQEWILDQRKSLDQLPGDEPPNNDIKAQSIECLINDDHTIQCLQSVANANDVFMPFSFIEKYFDVSGKIKHYDGYNRFEFSQSSFKRFFEPKFPYSYHGIFLNFDTYNVEYRDRVKCVSGIEGVPLSIQWNKKGYFYATQIAQFGLSHYCKSALVVGRPIKFTMYEDGENGIQSKWKTTNRHCIIKIRADQETRSNVVQFSIPETVPLGSGATLTLGNAHEYVVSLDLKFISNGSLSLVLDTAGKGKQYTIHYVTTNIAIEFDSHSNIFIGIGLSNSWRHISRDVLSDLRVVGSANFAKLKSKSLKVSRLILRGEGFIDNVTISKAAHATHIRDASDWLVKNQDKETGGWKNNVARSFGGFKTLPPGWISAMGQGQAMSLLARAYFTFGTQAYVKALSQAIKPFTVSSTNGGVRAVFMEKYVWYEEYPTIPSSFVLNGFIFSLIGLYDYKALLEDKFKANSTFSLPTNINQEYRALGVDLQNDYKLVARLFDEGMTSLKAMLPLYDGGSRTFYDLRHFMLKMSPNVARWDYHLVHINQLALLKSLSADPIFERYHAYWSDYTKGKFAPHN